MIDFLYFSLKMMEMIIIRKLRFREPVDDRSPEPNNNQVVNSFEEDLPAEPIPTIDMDIPSDPTGNQIKDISNLKTKVSNL